MLCLQHAGKRWRRHHRAEPRPLHPRVTACHRDRRIWQPGTLRSPSGSPGTWT